MEEKQLKVLLIEDSKVFTQLIKGYLDRVASESIVLECADNLGAGLNRLSQGGIDAVLLDLMLPDSGGIETLWKTLVHSPEVAIVVLTALDDEKLALTAVKRGAQEYLGKENLTAEILLRSIRHAVERKRLQVRLEHYADDLKRNNTDLTQFASVAAHDMQSPLQVVARTCRLLLENYRDTLDELATEHVTRSRDGVERMQRLLHDLVTYTSIGVRNHESAEEANCEEVLAQALNNLEDEIMRNSARITHDPLPTVRVAAADMTKVLQNLIENSIRYCSDTPPEIHLAAQKDADKWLFSVRDNGIGVDPDYPGQIFEAFQQLQPGKLTTGTGIGLAICKRLVENNGGSIWVDSEPGRGSTFYFTLPATL